MVTLTLTAFFFSISALLYIILDIERGDYDNDE